MNYRQLVQQFVQLGLIVTSALIIWKTLMVVTGSKSPVRPHAPRARSPPASSVSRAPLLRAGGGGAQRQHGAVLL